MITTLTLNPCIDHTIEVNGMEIGGTNRIKQVKKEVGGKGINVCTALVQLGYESETLLFIHEKEAVPLTKYLTEKGIGCHGVSVPGELRTNIKVFDAQKREMTEFNESGSPVPEAAADRMLTLIKEKLTETDILVVTGSVPPGVPADIYAGAIRLAKESGVTTILDGDGELLREGIKAKPDMIKPNIGELRRLLGRHIETEEEIIGAATELVGVGIPYVCVSVGADGAYLVCGDGVYFTKGAEITVRGVQGAGDSLVAGFAIGLQEKRRPAESLRLAVACANGSLTHEGTEMCTKEDVERLIGQVEVKDICGRIYV